MFQEWSILVHRQDEGQVQFACGLKRPAKWPRCRSRLSVYSTVYEEISHYAAEGLPVGGDLVKTVMLGHEHPQHRAKALASVLVDRVVGLYILFVVASVAILLTGFWRIPESNIHWIRKLTFALTIGGAVGTVRIRAGLPLRSRAGRRPGHRRRARARRGADLPAHHFVDRRPGHLLLLGP
jgi:hypothetical protein